ncbi:hypothetical protein ACFQGA_08740 [Marinobacter koreensis]|uniref:hypothetical protein n=1 Tax=Marinobacter koreensis TaxID=335974 RepID=UPI003613737C
MTRSETSNQPFLHWLLSTHGLVTAGAVVTLIGIGTLVRWVDLAGVVNGLRKWSVRGPLRRTPPIGTSASSGT